MSGITRFRAKFFISVLCSIFGKILPAQNLLMHGDTLVLNGQAKFWLNEELQFGSGTMPDKTYSYIYEAPNGLQKLVNDHKKKLMSAGYRGSKCKIVKFEKEIGHSKKENPYSILVLELPNGTRYWCDLQNAYASHEITTNTAGSNVAQSTPPDSNKGDTSAKKTSSSKSKAKKAKTSTTQPAPIF